MNWLRRIAYANPQNLGDVAKLIQKTITLEFDGSRGGWSYTQLQNIDPSLQPQACEMIKGEAEARANDPAATSILRVLSEGAGCDFNPENPPPEEGNMMDPSMDPNMMPMIGQQEKPMNMPSTEFE